MSKSIHRELPERCPHCDSDEGLYWDETVVYRNFAGWDGHQTASNFHRTIRVNRTAHCVSCGRGVRFDPNAIINR